MPVVFALDSNPALFDEDARHLAVHLGLRRNLIANNLAGRVSAGLAPVAEPIKLTPAELWEISGVFMEFPGLLVTADFERLNEEVTAAIEHG